MPQFLALLNQSRSSSRHISSDSSEMRQSRRKRHDSPAAGARGRLVVSSPLGTIGSSTIQTAGLSSALQLSSYTSRALCDHFTKLLASIDNTQHTSSIPEPILETLTMSSPASPPAPTIDVKAIAELLEQSRASLKSMDQTIARSREIRDRYDAQLKENEEFDRKYREWREYIDRINRENMQRQLEVPEAQPQDDDETYNYW